MERSSSEQHEGGAGTAGWPDLPGDTALTINVPQGDALVRSAFRPM